MCNFTHSPFPSATTATCRLDRTPQVLVLTAELLTHTQCAYQVQRMACSRASCIWNSVVHVTGVVAYLLQVLVTDGLWVPLVNLNNVYMLPGIPKLF